MLSISQSAIFTPFSTPIPATSRFDQWKSVNIRSYSGPYFPRLREAMVLNNSEYGHFLCGGLSRSRTRKKREFVK